MESILQQARIATDEIFKLYVRPWNKNDCWIPQGLDEVPPGTVFVVPTPSSSRGLQSKAVKVLRGPAYDVLEFFSETCAIIIGLGHEPEQNTCAPSSGGDQ